MNNGLKNCLGCNVEFSPKRKGKKFCSNKCYHSSKVKFVEVVCEACSNPFSVSYRFRGKKTCSRACFGKLISSQLSSKKIEKKCLACCNTFIVPESSDTKMYCSTECFYRHKYNRESASVIITCEACKKQFHKPFTHRKTRFCSKSCANSGERNNMFGKVGTMTGKIAWNRGLNKDTDDRIFSAGKKISELAKKDFLSGKRSNKGHKNPMFGHTPDMLTAEQRSNYSKAAIERVIKGQSGYKTRHISGTYVPKKCDAFCFKSSWELAAAMWWDESPDVLSYVYEPEVILLENGSRTIPDFKVTYVDLSIKFVEIKPTAIQKLESIQEKLVLTKKYLGLLGIDYILFGDVEIRQMINDLGDKFANEVKLHQNR